MLMKEKHDYKDERNAFWKRMSAIWSMPYPSRAGMIIKRGLKSRKQAPTALNRPDVVVGSPATLIEDNNVQIEIFEQLNLPMVMMVMVVLMLILTLRPCCLNSTFPLFHILESLRDSWRKNNLFQDTWVLFMGLGSAALLWSGAESFGHKASTGALYTMIPTASQVRHPTVS